jgi:valacyclovir hydrolase
MPWFEHGASRVYYEESGSGDPVLLLPGFSDSIAGHAVLRETLAKRYRVIAADLPGSGRSGPQPRSYSVRYYEEDASTFVALLRDLGAMPSHLVGFSDGGEVALMIAALSPPVARSVLVWGAAGFVSDPAGEIRAAFRDVVDHPIPSFHEYRDYLVATYGESNARAMTQSLAKALDAIVAAGGDISRSKASEITCAVLLIVGQHDFIVSKALVNELATQLGTVEVMAVEGAGHGVHRERPEWLAQTAAEWLARQG